MLSPLVPGFAATQSAGAPQPDSAAALPPHRVEGFARTVTARLREGATIQALITEQQALAEALTNPAFVGTAVASFTQAMKAEQPNAAYHASPAEARREIESILKNRVRDAQSFASLLAQPEFIARTRALAAEPITPPQPYNLPPGKPAEIIRRLVQPTDVDGPEPAVHVAASALGQQMVHQALAVTFQPDGALHAPLMTALRQAQPTLDEASIHRLTNQWLAARVGPAQAVADGLAPTGALYQEAMKLAEELQRHKLEGKGVPPTQALAQAAATTALTPVPLTPAEREAKKSAQHKAEDVIYTLNHAITCLGISDTLVTPAIGGVLSAISGKHVHIGCGQDHGHENPFLLNFWKKDYWKETWQGIKASTENVRANFWTKPFWKNLWAHSKTWMFSEVVGDVGAVPVAVAAQRFAPGFMHGLRRLMEPAVGGIFKRRAEASARNWGTAQGFAPDSQKVVDRAQELYEYEVSHLPQMAVWTAASVGMNFGTMKLLERNPNTPKTSLSTFVKGKALGAAVTAGLVFGARAFSPSTAHAWDETVGKNVILPVTKKIGHLFGVDPEHVDAFHAKNSQAVPPPTPRIEGTKHHAGALMGSPVALSAVVA